ncbi:MAG: peptide MFS transporter [Neisseriaceae bacterium]
MSLNIDVKTSKVGFWHFPKTFYTLLIIEFWERFAFYGLQSVAVIYFIKKFNLSESDSSGLFASFSALLYGLMVIGGFIGDRILGLRRCYLIGIVLFILGYGLLSFANTQSILYFSMGIVLVANVFFKTIANNYVSRCFEKNDPRLDSAFTYFYMSINIGSFSSLIIVPIISKTFGYSVGLALCSISMVCGLVFYLIFRERLKNLDNQVGKHRENKFFLVSLFLLISMISAYLVGFILKNSEYSRIFLYTSAAIILIIYLVVASKLPKIESQGMMVALMLALQAIIFFILYIQTATSFMLFAYHNIDLEFFGYKIPPGVTQAFNPVYIIILSPILSNIYLYFNKNKINAGIPLKFVCGIFSTSICFILLGFASNFFANHDSQIPVIWLFIAYGFYTLGELLVSALGPSMVSQLLPKRFGGFAQGFWYLCVAVGMKIGGLISSTAAAQYNSHDPAQSLNTYMHLFYYIGVAIFIVSGFLFFMVKPLNKAMNLVLERKY